MDIAEYSADEDKKEEGKASLHTATKEGSIDIVKLLLKLGKDINGRNTANQTPLVSAASNRNLDVVRLLIERGAEVDSRDIFGWTPLHYTSQDGHVEVSRVLTDHAITGQTWTQGSGIIGPRYTSHLKRDTSGW
jgi:ankyrin repeat protein